MQMTAYNLRLSSSTPPLLEGYDRLVGKLCDLQLYPIINRHYDLGTDLRQNNLLPIVLTIAFSLLVIHLPKLNYT
jgi:hypothetical protein